MVVVVPDRLQYAIRLIPLGVLGIPPTKVATLTYIEPDDVIYKTVDTGDATYDIDAGHCRDSIFNPTTICRGRPARVPHPPLLNSKL
ncbi:hypothetical protein D2E89_00800 [Mycobacteroides abscessus]|nr:hypothetical protein D2E89_00800 [Mycobacteroides abscessus]